MSNLSSNGIITLNRGDSFDCVLKLNNGTALNPQAPVLDLQDSVYMGVMEPNQPFEHAIIRKKFTSADLDSDGNLTIRFEPEDTLCLIPGKYYYQIKLETHRMQQSSSVIKRDVQTLIDKTLFYIQE